MERCTAKQGGYSQTQCKAIKQIASMHTRSKSKGLFFSSIVNLENGESLGIGFTVKTEQSPRGTYLNFCPFCGGELRDMSEDGKND